MEMLRSQGCLESGKPGEVKELFVEKVLGTLIIKTIHAIDALSIQLTTRSVSLFLIVRKNVARFSSFL